MPSYRNKRPRIQWGTSFLNALFCPYPLDNVTTGEEPRAGCEWQQGPSGIEDAWITGVDQVLQGDMRFIPQADQVYLQIENDGISITDAKYGGTVVRATVAYELDVNGIYQQRASGIDRCNHYVNGVRTRLAGEPQRANSALGSCGCDNTTTYWAKSGTLSAAAAARCAINGQTGYVHTNVAAADARYQYIGTFVNGQTDVLSIVVEQGTGTKTQISIRDATALANVGLATLTWAGLSILTGGVVSAAGVQSLGVGPNGGALVLLWLACVGTASGTAASGNTRQLIWTPSGGIADTAATTVHHLQFEANALFPTTPIVTVGAAVTRNAEIVSVPLPSPAQPAQSLGFYQKYVDLGGSLLGYGLYLGSVGDSFTGPIVLLAGMAGGAARIVHANGVDAYVQGLMSAVVPAYGDQVEQRSLLLATGAVQCGAARNGASETLGAASAAPPAGIIIPWHNSGTQRVYIGSIGSTASGGFATVSLLLTTGAPSMDAFRLAAGQRPGTGWDGATGFRAFLAWARQKNQFRFYPDSEDASTYLTCYLVDPTADLPTSETDGTRKVTLKIRNATSSFDGY